MATSTRRLESILTAYWKLDSSHGANVAADAIGTNTLNQGGVGSGAGKRNECATFARASSQYLGITSNSSLQSLKSLAFWVKFTTLSNEMSIIHKGTTATAANSSVWVKYQTSHNRLQFQVGDGAGGSASVSTSGVTFATGTWYFVCCRYDTSAQQLSISVNGVVSGTTAATLTQFVETGTFYLGRDATGNYLDGALDEVCVSQSSLTIAEELLLYNGGDGIQPPFLEGPMGPDGSSGRYPRRLPPSFALADNGKLFVAFGDEPVKVWDGQASSFVNAGVPAPTAKPAISSAGEGRILGERYAYVRNLDAQGRVSNLSPISDMHIAAGASKAITNATNTAPIVITSSSHGLSTGEYVYVRGVQGNKAANGAWYVVVRDSNTFELVGSEGSGEYLGVDSGRIAVTTLRDGAAAVNEVQTITASATPASGTWKITHDGNTTGALQYNANAATVQSALELLSSIGAGNVSVTGGPLGTAAFTVTFQGAEGGTNQNLLTVDASGLSGANVAISVVTLQDGSAGTNEVQSLSLYGTPTGGTFTLTFDGQTTAAIAYNADAATVQTALEALSNIAPGDVTCGGGPFPGTVITVTFGGAYANTNVPQITLNPANLTGGSISVSMSTVTNGVAGSLNAAYWWYLDESSGTRYAAVGGVDLSEAGWHGSSTIGKIGDALLLGGTSAFYSGWNFGDGPSGDMSVVAWIYISSASSGVVVCSYRIIPMLSALSWSLLVLSGAPAFLARDSTDTTWETVSGSAVTLNAWHFIVGVVSKSENLIKLSVDGGTFSTTALSSPGYNYGKIAIGGIPNLDGTRVSSGVVGGIDEVGVFATALTQAQVTALYNGGSGRRPPFTGIGTNEVQRITVNGSPSQGTFTLTYSGQTTSPIAYNATASTVQAALAALSNIGTGNVSCTGGPLPGAPVDIEFKGSLAATDVAQITADDALLKCSYSTTTAGSAARSEVQRISVNVTPTSGTFTVTFGANTTAAQPYNVTASALQAALEGLPSIGAGNISVTGGPLSSGSAFICTFQGALANANQAAMSAASSLFGTTPTVTVTTTTDGVPGANERQQFYTVGTINGGTWTASYSGQTTSPIAYNATASTVQAALAALSNIGTGNVSCTGGPLHVSPIVVEFQGSLATTNVAEMTVDNAGITTGGWSRGAQSLTYSNVEAPTDRRVVKRQILRNKFGDASVFYVDVETSDLTATTFTSYLTDEELGEAVPLQDDNGNDLNVTRHGVPPNDKRAIASFQSRLFLAVNHRHEEGELTATNGATVIGGEDAFFRAAFDARTVYPLGSGNTANYEIDSVDVKAQTVTATASYKGTTAKGVNYAIETAQPQDVTIYFSEEDDPEWWDAAKAISLPRDIDDGPFTGIMPLINSVLFLFAHRMYRLTFRASPSPADAGGDGRIVAAAWRGCINNRCFVEADGLAFLMDNRGCYTFNESDVDEISDPESPLFRPGHPWSINWERREYFHAGHDPEAETVLWFVTIGDGFYPRHALCYHYRRKRWWLEEYPWPITASCTAHIDGHEVLLLASTGRRVLARVGNLDGINLNAHANTLRGTVTAATPWTLTDSTASFGTLTNLVVTIAEGTGAGQQRLIVANTATTLTLKEPWTIQPDTTSTYQIGGIKWTWKSGTYRLTQKGSEDQRGVELTFRPLSRPSSVTLRSYPDFDTTATTMEVTHESDGVSTSAGTSNVLIDLTTASGFAGIYTDAFFTGRGTHQRYMTTELEGVTNGERHQIKEIAVVGVEG